MSMRMELSDLPPKYRAQAEAQIAARSRAKAPPLEAVAAAAKKTGREFDSRGEYDYYMGMILPKVQRGAGALWSTLPLILQQKSKHGRSASNRPKGKDETS